MAPTPAPVPGKDRIRLTIASRLAQVPLVSLAIRGLLQEAVPDPVARYQIEVAVVEAVNNAIQHAYDLREDGEVEIHVAFPPGELLFAICDRGRRNDVYARVDLNYDPRDIARLPEGGMGIPLMRLIMDEVSYTTQRGQNCLTLRKRL